MKILVCGGRDYDNDTIIWTLLAGIKQWWIENGPDYDGDDGTIILVEGEAKGADTLARIAGESLGYVVRKYPADWDRYGKAAGPIRNRQQYDTEQPDVVFAFSDDFENSRGTKDMATYAISKGTPTYLITRLGP